MINWDTAYTVGNNQIDFEHQIFLNLVNSFQAYRLAGASSGKLINKLREIALYAKFHFCSEENLMEDVGYPELETHRNSHYHLCEILSNKMLGFEMGTYTAESVETFLIEWFVSHVTHEDVKIERFIRASGHEQARAHD